MNQPGNVYCWSSHPAGPIGLRSEDGGLSWSEEDQPIPAAAFAETPPILESEFGLRLSTDGGRTFEALNPPVDEGLTGAAALSDRRFLVATERAVYRSEDAGAGWVQVGLDLGGVEIRNLTGRPGDDRRAWLLTTTGLFESDDAGDSWARIVNQQGTAVPDVWVDPADPMHVLAVRVVTFTGGEPWQILDDPDLVRGFAYETHPLDPQLVFLRGFFGDSAFSRNSGRDWEMLARPSGILCRASRLDPSVLGTFYCLSHDRLLRTDDFGGEWQALGSPMEAPAPPHRTGFARALAVTDGSLWVVRDFSDSTLVRSDDGGATWQLLGAIPFEVRGIEADRSTESVFLFGELDPSDEPRIGVVARWDSDSGALADRRDGFGGPVNFLRQNPLRPSELVIGTFGGGLWASADRGRHWRPTVPIAVPSASSVRWSGETIYAATAEGVFRADASVLNLSCVETDEVLCLQDERYAVAATWATSPTGPTGRAQARPLTADTGAFWFFSPNNLELLVKVLDGCHINGFRWVFAAGLTDVAVDVEVTDSVSGATWTGSSPAGTPFQPIFDTRAFSCSG